jgi:predicted RNA-binding protein (virulence factor B family)
MEEDAEFILHRLEDADGFLPYHDKSAPEEIKSHFHMSKNAFKRAVGRLLKEGKIEITQNSIVLKK